MTASTVVVPTCGGGRLERLLSSLAAQTVSHQVLVVDNASEDPSIPELVEGTDGAAVIAMETNVGFGRAVNIAAAQADGDAIVVVNDDCVCDPQFVEAITASLDPGAGVVAVAGVMRQQQDQAMIDTAGVELDRTLMAFDYLHGVPLGRLAADTPAPVGPSGAAAAFDRESFREIGGYDENLFAYLEDVDLALRLREVGGRCALAQLARGTHEHSGTLGAGSARKNYLMGFGRGYLLRKWSVLTARRALPVASRELVICAGQGLLDRNLAGVRGRVNGYRSAVRSHAYPHAVLAATPKAGSNLTRRLRRRTRLRARSRSDASGTRVRSDRQRPRRILIVLHASEVGGPARTLQSRLPELVGHAELELVVPGPGPNGALGELAEVTQLEYSTLMAPQGVTGLGRDAVQLFRDVRTLRAHIGGTQPDLVISVTAMLPAAMIAARLERVPCLLDAAEIIADGRGGGLPRSLAAKALVATASGLADRIVACSNAVASQFPRRAVTVIYPAVGDEYADGDGSALRRRFGVSDGAVCIAVVGNITFGRGQDVLIKALPSIRASFLDVRLLIVGIRFDRPKDIEFERMLKRLVADLGLGDAVTFCGFIDRIADLYAAADIVVNPARAPEAFGRVAFEALMAGCPVVSTPVGAVPELLVDGETAVFVPPDDIEALAAAIANLLEDAELAGAIATRGRELASARLDPASHANAFRDLIQVLIGSSQAG
jgi:N-acetylglucosaminyl-diphospho-decaprenol L-rhamnosyltransferase